MSRLAVRRLFVAVLILLPLQYALVGVVGLRWSEPWPALVMPGFQRVYTPDALREQAARFEVTYADGHRLSLTAAAMLHALPRSHHGGVLNRQFRPAGLSGTPATERAREGRDWLIRQVQPYHPEADPIRLDVIWEEVRFHPLPDAPVVERHPLDTLSIDLR